MGTHWQLLDLEREEEHMVQGHALSSGQGCQWAGARRAAGLLRSDTVEA